MSKCFRPPDCPAGTGRLMLPWACIVCAGQHEVQVNISQESYGPSAMLTIYLRFMCR